MSWFVRAGVAAGLVLGTITSPIAARAASAAIAPNTIYMVTFGGNSTLNRLSPATGARTLIGNTGAPLTDLSFRGGILNAVSFTKLYVLNPTTGHATTVGRLGFSDINALVTRPSTGKLYGAGNAAPGRFVSINATTGHAHQIGTFGAGLGSAGDLAFVNGTLYATVNRAGFAHTYFAKVSLSTGHATLIADTGFPNVWGLTLRSGVLYAATKNGLFLRISPTTGRATRIGSNGAAQAGLATSPRN